MALKFPAQSIVCVDTSDWFNSIKEGTGKLNNAVEFQKARKSVWIAEDGDQDPENETVIQGNRNKEK